MIKNPETILLFALITLMPLMTSGQQAVNADTDIATAVHDAKENNDADEMPAVESSAARSTANELVSLSGNTLMTAGTCLVIDDLVRQFCSANPGDVSCQYQ